MHFMRRRAYLIPVALIGAALSLVLLIAAYERWRRGAGEKPALKINGRSIAASTLRTYFREKIGDLAEQVETDLIKKKILEDFIDEQLLLAEAEKAGIDVPDEQVRELARAIGEGADDSLTLARLRDELKIQKYLEEKLFADIGVSEQEAEQHYNERRKLAEANRLEVSEILVASEQLAAKIRELLRRSRNANFAELAGLYSLSPSAANGGLLGSYRRGELPAELEKIIFGLTPGQPSAPVKTQYGYHIFLVRPVKPPSYAEARPEIIREIEGERRRARLAAKLEELRRQAAVQILDEELDLAANRGGWREANKK